MDSMYLDPKRVSLELIGSKYECHTCKRTRLFEEGKTFLVTIDSENGAHYGFLWFCSLACLTSTIEGGTA